MQEIIVIKYGGNAIEDINSLQNFATALKKLRQIEKRKIVLIHGGGPQINHWLQKTNLTSKFIDGQRYTDEKALEVVEMVLCANVNKAIVRALLKENIPSVGISGEDGNTLEAVQNHTLGLVGEIKTVNCKLILQLLEADFLPVIAPLGISEDKNTALNINADYCAANIAAALNADECLFMSNVDGILGENKTLINKANSGEIKQLIKNGIISGGMIPKVNCALFALEKQVKKVRIINGENPENLLMFNTLGTEIVL
ncbi:MAG: acetylglutamate kinase [Cardiobacteriaceae bacterium]|nr:acetylglutamate kinase [Cardiobacteriaceae bacterium]